MSIQDLSIEMKSVQTTIDTSFQGNNIIVKQNVTINYFNKNIFNDLNSLLTQNC